METRSRKYVRPSSLVTQTAGASQIARRPRRLVIQASVSANNAGKIAEVCDEQCGDEQRHGQAQTTERPYRGARPVDRSGEIRHARHQSQAKCTPRPDWP